MKLNACVFEGVGCSWRGGEGLSTQYCLFQVSKTSKLSQVIKIVSLSSSHAFSGSYINEDVQMV